VQDKGCLTAAATYEQRMADTPRSRRVPEYVLAAGVASGSSTVAGIAQRRARR
jgi:hypothetical protein